MADASVAGEELLEPPLDGIDIDELGEDIEPAGCDEDDFDPLLDVHAVVASASATTALPIVMAELRNDIRNSCVAGWGMYSINSRRARDWVP